MALRPIGVHHTANLGCMMDCGTRLQVASSRRMPIQTASPQRSWQPTAPVGPLPSVPSQRRRMLPDHPRHGALTVTATKRQRRSSLALRETCSKARCSTARGCPTRRQHSRCRRGSSRSSVSSRRSEIRCRPAARFTYQRSSSNRCSATRYQPAGRCQTCQQTARSQLQRSSRSNKRQPS